MSENTNDKVFTMFTLSVPSQSGPSQKITLNSDGAFENLVDGRQISDASARRSLLIGSAEGNDIRREDPTVSRYHAELRFDKTAQTWTISDLGSSNGTLLIYTDEKKREHREPVPANRFVRLKEQEHWRIEVGNISIRVRHPNRRSATPSTDGPALPGITNQVAPSDASSAPQASWYLTVRYPSGWERTVELTGTTFGIGTDLSNELPLSDDMNVSPHHALLMYERQAGPQALDGPGWYVLDLGSTSGTFIDNLAVAAGKRYLLKDGQLLAIGSVQLTYQQMRERWRLQIYQPGKAMRELVLADSPYTIGGAGDNDYQIDPDETQPDGDIAPYHAQLLEGSEGWMIRDLGSRIGTRVNSLMIQPFARYLLREHNQFDIGATTFVIVKRNGQASAAPQGLRISFETGVLYCTVGETLTTTIELVSDIPDAADLQAELTAVKTAGKDTAAQALRTENWIGLTSRHITLDPGEHSFVELSIQIPDDPALADYTYTLVVTSRGKGVAAASAQATLEVQRRLELLLEPTKVSVVAGRATATTLTLHNHTNSAAVVDLLANPLGSLPARWVQFEQDPVRLDAQQSRKINVNLHPEAAAIRTLESYAFEVIGRSNTLGEARVTGTLVVQPHASLRLETDEFTVVAGQSVRALIDVSAIADDTFALSVEELPGHWATFSEHDVTTSDGHTKHRSLTIQTDWSEAMQLGLRTFRVVGTGDHLGRVVSEAKLTLLAPILFKLEPNSLTVVPGTKDELLIDITSEMNGKVTLSVNGLPPGWGVLSATEPLELKAADRRVERLVIQPPADAPLRDYSFELTGTLVSTNQVLTRAAGTLHLATTAITRPPLLTLEQRSLVCASGRPATVMATVTNSSGMDDTVRLSIPSALVHWAITLPAEVRLEPGKSQDVLVTIEPHADQAAGAYPLSIHAESSWSGQSEIELAITVPPAITMRLRSTSLRTAPGQAISTDVEVRSDGPEEVRLAVVGPIKRWATFEPDLVRLRQGQTEVVRLTIAPPDQHEDTLGTYNFQVLARGTNARQHVAQAELVIAAPPQLQLAPDALTVAVGQSITTELTITSNTDIDDLVLLTAGPDTPVGPWVTFSEPRVRLRARATRQVQLQIAVPGRATPSVGSYAMSISAAAYHGGRAVVGTTLTVVKPDELRLDSNMLTVEAGSSIATTITITNTWTERDSVTFSVEGPPRNWASFKPATVRLEPGETSRVTLTIQAPREPEGRAAVYDFAVVATWEQSRARPYRNANLTITTSEAVSAFDLLRKTNKISLLLSQELLAIEAGQVVTATVVVKNLWKIVDRVSFSARGIPEAWVTFAPSSVALLPGDASEVTMLIQPPRDWSSSAGVHYFTVVGISEEDPQEEAVASAALSIAPFSEFSIDVQPRQQTHWHHGRYNLSIVNRSNYGQAYDIGGRDEEDLIVLGMPKLRPVLEAGAEKTIRIDAEARRWLWYGVQRIHTLTLRVAPAGSVSGGETVSALPPQEQTARLIQQPVFSIGVLLILFLLLLALLAPVIMAYWNRMLTPAAIATIRPTAPAPATVSPIPVAPTPVATATSAPEAPTPQPQVVTTIVEKQITALVVVTAVPPPTAYVIPTPTSTPAPTATPGIDAFCGKYPSLVLQGPGSPHTGVLLYFNGRAISGTVVRSNGRWSLPLFLSDEPLRTVVVRDRITQAILYEKICR